MKLRSYLNIVKVLLISIFLMLTCACGSVSPEASNEVRLKYISQYTESLGSMQLSFNLHIELPQKNTELSNTAKLLTELHVLFTIDNSDVMFDPIVIDLHERNYKSYVSDELKEAVIFKTLSDEYNLGFKDIEKYYNKMFYKSRALIIEIDLYKLTELSRYSDLLSGEEFSVSIVPHVAVELIESATKTIKLFYRSSWDKFYSPGFYVSK